MLVSLKNSNLQAELLNLRFDKNKFQILTWVINEIK